MRRKRVPVRSERTRMRTYKTAEMVLVYMLKGRGQQDQFRLRFHPAIVGSALDVCQWVRNPRPIVQNISAKNERVIPSGFRPARSRSGDFPDLSPFPSSCTVHPQATGLPLLLIRSQSYPKPLAAMAPKFVGIFVCFPMISWANSSAF